MKKWTSFGSILWLILHIVIVCIGVAVTGNQWLATTIGQNLAQAVGTSLVATGAAGMVLFLYIRSTDELRHRIELVTNAGLSEIFRQRAANIRSEYDSRLASAQRIDVIGWGLSAFREDYGDQFPVWAARGHVRILVVDPDYPAHLHSLADLRDAEENRPVGDIRRQVQQFRNLVEQQGLIASPRFQVRLMRSIPAINLLRADHEIFWGPYLMAEQSRNTPTLLVRQGGYLFDVLAKHFDEVWQHSVALQ
jgi:hypothetical protein